MPDSKPSLVITVPLKISKLIVINIIVSIAVMAIGHAIFYTFA